MKEQKSIFSSVRALFSSPKKHSGTRVGEVAARRSLLAAMPGVSSSDITRMTTSANDVIRIHLAKMRAQSRGLALNNDYVKRFLGLCEHNVVGPDGVRLQIKARDLGGTLDVVANRIIENAFIGWTKAINCDVKGRDSFRSIQRAAVRTMARDGECFFRKVKNFSGSAHRFALQQIPAELIDESFNDDSRRIVCGIEFNEWGRASAYYVRQDRAFNETLIKASNGRVYARIPAEDMVHMFIAEFSDQVRGIPWIHTAMIRLHQLGSYEEAEVVAARIGASKMGFIVTPDGSASGLFDGKVDDRGFLSQEVSPGMIETLPAGTDFRPFDPTHPSGNFGGFIKATLRGISSGLGVSYNALANDLENVNYSSIRAGLIEERETWRSLQAELREQFLDKIFGDWLEYAFLSGALNPLPFSKYEKFNAPKWNFRGWSWVDPQKDIDANVTAINNGLKTRTQVLAENGLDFEEVLEQLSEEQALIERYGVNISADQMQPRQQFQQASE